MKGKKALITGAAKRIGQAIACRFAEESIDIILHYNRSGQEAEELNTRLKETGVRTWIFQADLSSQDEGEELFEKALSACGSIDYLINNASLFPDDTLINFTARGLFENISVNTLAPLFLSRKFAGQNRKGKIINLLDARITDYDSRHVSYHLSKRMLYDLTRLMAIEFAPGIMVNAVAPGLILPPPGQGPEFLDKMKYTNPLQAYGTLKEIADAVIFLLKAEFITGQIIYVDGGRHLKGCVY
ncbi:MAG: SDR family oxidoreductase [Spirochaetales bacterium]|nr:SDR family oxidoreductase [Spirochaetales bacterium]